MSQIKIIQKIINIKKQLNNTEQKQKKGKKEMNSKNNNYKNPAKKMVQVKEKKRKAVKFQNKLIQRKASDYCDYRIELSKKFQEINRSHIFVKVKNNFLKMLGKHWPINYHQKFNFKEQWEMNNVQAKQPQYKNSHLYLVVSLFRLLLMVCNIWAMTTNLFFDIQQDQWIYAMIVLQAGIEMIKAIFLFDSYTLSSKLQRIIMLLICYFYGLFFLIFGTDQVFSSWSRIIGIIIVVHSYTKVSKIYQSIKYYNISSHYRDIVNLFQLSFLLITITHIFALLFSFTAHLTPKENWMTKVGIDQKSWEEQYVYSLYFSSTTLLTVGYGDLAPTNIRQILAVLLSQFFGIATFGYTVNQIGMVLSNMQLKTERLQKDLSTVENIGKSSRLQPDLICKMRSEVINNKRLHEDLCLGEENQLLDTFSQDMRQRIKFQANIKAIKRSVQMVVNWSGKMQNKIADRLIKEVYKEEQVLLQQSGKQKLYILQKGQIDIIKSSTKTSFQKVLKSICAKENNDLLAENLYGYSFLLSDRKLNLTAIAKETSICYTLPKNDFLQLLGECQQDLQHYHELKTILYQTTNPQSIQAPSIANIRQHFCPSTIYLARRKKQQKKPINTRKSIKTRNPVRRKLILLNISIKTSQNFNLKNEKVLRSVKEFMTDEITNFGNFSLESHNTSPQQNQQFETCKSYERYFKKGNVQNVVKKLSTKNYGHKIQIKKHQPNQNGAIQDFQYNSS